MPFPDYEPTIPIFLEHCVEQWGDRPLIVLGERRITYAGVEAESAKLARGLLARGVGKGTRVGVLFPNGPEWAIAWLAAARIGALTVPIKPFSKARELGWILRHADVRTRQCAKTQPTIHFFSCGVIMLVDVSRSRFVARRRRFYGMLGWRTADESDRQSQVSR